MKKKLIFLILIIFFCFCTNTFAQLGAIGEFIGIGESEEKNLGAIRTLSGGVMEKGTTGFGFIYQYIRFVSFEGNDLLTSFISKGKYNFREYETGKSYFISHGVSDKLTFSIYINDFSIQEKYFTWQDTNNNKKIDESIDNITYKTNTYQDLSQIWLQGTYQILKKSDDFKLAFNNVLKLPTAYEENISKESPGIYTGLSFSKKIFESYLLGDVGYSFYGISPTHSVAGSETGKTIYSFYPGDVASTHLALIYPASSRFTLGGELIAAYYLKSKTTAGSFFGQNSDIVDFSPMAKFKINKNTVFYTSVSYNLRSNITWGYDYGYIFGINYLFN